MKRKFIHDISANSLQAIINQCCGVLIFYVLSIHFNKEEFGEINWTLAVLLTAFSMLSFGIDQVSIKKIASGIDAGQILSIYIMHVLLAGTLFYIAILVSGFFFTDLLQQHYLLLFFGAGKLMIFFSTPFKQLAIGMEKFSALLFMSTCSNVIRSIALIIFSVIYPLSLHVVIIIFISGDMIELLLCLLITKWIIKTSFAPQWNKQNYLSLIKESIPLGGVAVFTSAIARFDWVFLGLLASNIVLAEYSFAYKAFEVATLPLFIIAPVLIPRFTKLFHEKNTKNQRREKELFILLRIEIIIASLVVIVLNIVWVPFIDFITHNKYGAADHYTILILSACMPLLYINNFLWTILFAKGNFKQIFYIIAVTFIVNIVGDIILILLFKAEGAAVAYLLALIVQLFLYWRKITIKDAGKALTGLLVIPVIAVVSYALSMCIFVNTYLALVSAVLLFIAALFFSKKIQWNDWVVFMRVIGL